MAAIPYMPLYIADYMADAAHLTTLEHGAYLLLIMTYWQRGKPLDNSNGRLANVARMSNEEWKNVEQTLSEFFIIEGDVWKHKRIEAELNKFKIKSDKASMAGKSSALRRSERKNTPQQTPNERSTDVQRTCNHTDTDTDTDTDISKKEKILTTFVQKKPTQEILPIIEESPEAPIAETKKPKFTKGTRLPVDWVLQQADGDWAEEQGLDGDCVLAEANKFRDYWHAKAGRDATKLDWVGTWRNWVRKAVENQKNQQLRMKKYG